MAHSNGISRTRVPVVGLGTMGIGIARLIGAQGVEVLTSLVAAGKTGAKAGTGFYPHTDQTTRDSVDHIARPFLYIESAGSATPTREQPGGYS